MADAAWTLSFAGEAHDSFLNAIYRMSSDGQKHGDGYIAQLTLTDGSAFDVKLEAVTHDDLLVSFFTEFPALADRGNNDLVGESRTFSLEVIDSIHIY